MHTPRDNCRTLGAILAGGQGRRMGGRDKAEIVLAGEPLIAHVHRRLAPQVGRLVINARHGYGFDLPVIADRPAGVKGPLAGIAAVLAWLEAGHAPDIEAIATAPVDAPLLPRDLVARLSAAGGPAVAETAAGLQPVFGYWPLDALRAARALFDRPDGAAVAALVDATAARRVRFEDADAFLNINRPEDLAAAGALLGTAGRTGSFTEGLRKRRPRESEDL